MGDCDGYCWYGSGRCPQMQVPGHGVCSVPGGCFTLRVCEFFAWRDDFVKGRNHGRLSRRWGLAFSPFAHQALSALIAAPRCESSGTCVSECAMYVRDSRSSVCRRAISSPEPTGPRRRCPRRCRERREPAGSPQRRGRRNAGKLPPPGR